MNAALFAIQNGGIINISETAKFAIVISIVTAGNGIAYVPWLLIRYIGTDNYTFMVRIVFEVFENST